VLITCGFALELVLRLAALTPGPVRVGAVVVVGMPT
jgi:hypothetical protein